MKRFGAVLFVVGLLLVLAGIAAAVFGGTRAVDAVESAVDEAASMPGGQAVVVLGAGDSRTVYEETQQPTPSARCTVVDDADNSVDFARNAELSGSFGDVSYANVGSFEAASPGPYTVTCTGAAALVIGPSLRIDTVGTSALTLIGGVLGVGLGLFLMLIGVILYFVGRSRAKKETADPAAGGYGSGTYGSPPPPPPAGY